MVITLGTAWYPEHWPESMWASDLELMRVAKINLVRVAEFAWSRLEPHEGQFELDWLERAVNLAAQQGMSIVLGTPTAAPSAWLTQRYPETLALREDGKSATHGMRCHYSATSPVYLDFCRRIAGVMAQRFGTHPHVIGWQIDNEYNSYSFDAETQRQFQAWLADRFGTLEALAERWTTAYWSEDYTDWSQIPLPVGNHNPGLVLAFRQFMTDVYLKFQQTQIEAIRQYADPRQEITHNFMKWNDGFDHYKLAAALDFAGWDNYVPTGHLDFLENGAMHDIVRGFKRKNFWILETQPGQVNWGKVNTTLDRGEVRAMAWHAIAHGADSISYWQWRSALGGQEQMHGTLLAPDGKPRPVYYEIAQLGADFEKIGALLEGSTPQPEIALIHSYEDNWALNFQRHHQGFDPIQHLLAYYRQLHARGIDLDIVSPEAPLNPYKLVIAPHLHLIDDLVAAHMLRYIENGGHLVLGIRSGVKDAFNALHPCRQPGPLASVLGATVEEYYALAEAIPVGGAIGEGSAHIWAEQLHPETDVEVLLRYGASNGWLDDQPAMVTRVYGKGRITYLGAWFEPSLMAKAMEWCTAISQIAAPELIAGSVPAGVEVCQRIKRDAHYTIVINFKREAQRIALTQPCTDVLTGKTCEGFVNLPYLGLVVLHHEIDPLER
jgi:beta-galactosidase